ncbi:hypothetical protein RhiirA5_378108 [Rhizophagus irregularis]|uniref:Uncharacterized protein n=3 Tax=Rhizophagus irregularis TaxID=588596 RepID=A0A2N0RYU9_9GLOM|nr:hypothetical protein GLOIN_2v1782024 [Rhizophagus irregularis DAOM 181602=DAOM 197198]EXX57099.1 hypothetical protein RirG_210320 [Rhizophagus irregularis DAOM 197198w]PKC06083.1 hypothetical protein RhiirA5_378108 [Rhizophagus irregularis]PKC68495.1 hypothetical protein RhiirA1_392848 [Rhizophagus irregularis]POG65142.1 hypothetical protein GLOIN_2v1782024 [Rhizophagus irregularis DAOM 181602=DAOM 197198]UZO11080.1 hypothetical protein OCT59_002654 [Rhizophagus irregularis]|eukprot:XP_025172008.1 hypothetical protein GLOIN_2v1782024 [Rhizophagus irregularis DAOM 181602=DAOM 197198]
MDRFLNHMDYNDIFSFLNINEQVHKLARDGTISQMLAGKELLKICLNCKLQSDNQRDIIDIDSATNEIWNSRLTISQKKQFKNLADNLNKARNAKNIELIILINTPQITTTAFESSFFNGASFHDDKSLEPFLPLGVAYGGSFW